MQANFMPVYSEHMRNLLKEGINHPEHYDKPLKGFHFLVDAGNGGGGFFATEVLAPLGADITGTLQSLSFSFPACCLRLVCRNAKPGLLKIVYCRCHEYMSCECHVQCALLFNVEILLHST